MKRIFKWLVIFFTMFLAIVLLLSFNNHFMKKIYPLKYRSVVEKYSKEYGVRESLIFAVIKAESDFNEFAKSNAGAVGLMQITKETFNWLKQKKGEKDCEDLYNIEINIKFGVYFLSFLISKYKDEQVALCAYNAGIGNVDSWLKNKNYSEDTKTLIKIPFKETEEYVKKIIKTEKIYLKLYFKE